MKVLGIISVGFNITDQLLIKFFALSNTGEKIGSVFIGFKKAYDSVR
jgi:hypothetical protein